MPTWVLIMTLIARESAVVSSAPGFTSEASCQQAGQAWKVGLDIGFHSKAVAVCVKQ